MDMQKAAYALELGKGAVWLRRIMLVIGFLALAGWNDYRGLNGFHSMEAMDSAQIARNLSRGQGFSTEFIRPLALAQLRDHDYRKTGAEIVPGVPVPSAPRNLARIPDTFNPPVYPVVLAALFKATGVSFDVAPEAIQDFRVYKPEVVVVLFNQLLIALSALLLFLLARSLFDVRVAWLGTVVFVLSRSLWIYSISGLPMLSTLFLLLAACYGLQRALLAEEDSEATGEGAALRVWGWLLPSGIALGLAFLTDYAAGLLFLPFLLAVGFGFRARAVLIPALAVLWLLLFAPWAARNIGLTGNPFGGSASLLLAENPFQPGNLVPRTYNADANAEVWKTASFIHIVASALSEGINYHFREAYKLLGSGAALCFVLAGLVQVFRRRRANLLRGFLIVSLLVVAAGESLVKSDPDALGAQNHFFLLWPLVALFGSAFFFVLLDRFNITALLMRRLALALFVFLNAVPLALELLPQGRVPFQYPPYFPPVAFYMTRWFQPDEVIASDLPWFVAWYEDRPSLWLPTTIKDFVEINDVVCPIRGLLITAASRNSRLLTEIDKNEWKEWAPLIRGQSIPDKFPLTAYTPLPPENDALLLADRPRWQPSPSGP